VLVEVAGTDEALALLRAERPPAVTVTDVVPAARTVLFDGVADSDALARWLAGLDLATGPAASGAVREVEVPTVYDGADLDEVARLWEMTTREVVATHTAVAHTVAFCGFAPGFAYCTGIEREVPRLASPRARVPAGSVGLAGPYTGIYPSASPGGWRLVGRTDLTLWDDADASPALLTPGTVVRFVRVGP
jgi:KipI family sensor histidine kinase inhibitor